MALFECNIKSDVLELNVAVNVIIPQDVKKGEKLQAVYLLHGYIGNHTDWCRYSSVERYAWEHRFAIIMPGVNNSYYSNTKFGQKYLDYVSIELPEIMSRMFPVSEKREDNFVCGLSMGGYGALRVALHNPKRFSKAASLSGAVNIDSIKKLVEDTPRKHFTNATFGEASTKDTENDLLYLIQTHQKNKQELPNIYLACGTEDFLYKDNLEFKKEMDYLKVPYTYEESKGDHNWAFWDEYLQKVLYWLEKKV